MSTCKTSQLPAPAVELIVEFSGDPFSVMALNLSMKGCVTQLFRERARAEKVRQLSRILRPIVRQSMETQRKSVCQKSFRRLHNHLHRLSPRLFGQGPTFSQREYVVQAMDKDSFDILALKISIDKIPGGPEFLRKRGDFFIKVLMKSVEAYGDYFPRTQPDDPDRIEEWIAGLETSIRSRAGMQCVEEEREQFSPIFGRKFSLFLSLILPWITLGLTRHNHCPERMGDWRIWFNRDPMEDNALHEARIRDCYVISSIISWIDCLSNNRRKIDLMRRLETECIVPQRLPDIIQNRWRLYMTKHLKKTRNLSGQEREWERLALESVRTEKRFLKESRRRFWFRIVPSLVVQGFIMISLVWPFVRSLWLGKQRLQICLKCAHSLFLIVACRLWLKNLRNAWVRVGSCFCAFVVVISAAIGGRFLRTNR